VTIYFTCRLCSPLSKGVAALMNPAAARSCRAQIISPKAKLMVVPAEYLEYSASVSLFSVFGRLFVCQLRAKYRLALWNAGARAGRRRPVHLSALPAHWSGQGRRPADRAAAQSVGVSPVCVDSGLDVRDVGLCELPGGLGEAGGGGDARGAGTSGAFCYPLPRACPNGRGWAQAISNTCLGFVGSCTI
jgi:hypothetical protein